MLTGRESALLLALVLAGCVPLATAQDLLANIRQCAVEPDDARRLACYDRQFRVLSANSQSQPQPAEQRFGMNGQVERNDPTVQSPKLDKLTDRVTAVQHKPRGEAVFKLESGQVWEEADGETPIELKVGETVTIDAGVMGAYWLLSKNGSVRVKRTR